MSDMDLDLAMYNHTVEVNLPQRQEHCVLRFGFDGVSFGALPNLANRYGFGANLALFMVPLWWPHCALQWKDWWAPAWNPSLPSLREASRRGHQRWYQQWERSQLDLPQFDREPGTGECELVTRWLSNTFSVAVLTQVLMVCSPIDTE